YELTPDPRDVILASTATPTTPIAFTAQSLGGNFLLVPSAPLAEGSYVLVDHTLCEANRDAGPRATFTVSPAAAMPTELGALVAVSSSIMQIDVANSTGSCSSQATVAQASIELAPSASTAAWLDALHFETLVDGKTWHYQTSSVVLTAPGASATGRGRDRVFSICSSSDST